MIDYSLVDSSISNKDLKLLAVYNKYINGDSFSDFVDFLSKEVKYYSTVIYSSFQYEYLKEAYQFSNKVNLSSSSINRLFYLKTLIHNKTFVEGDNVEGIIKDFNFNINNNNGDIDFAYYVDLFNMKTNNSSILKLSSSLRTILIDVIPFVKKEYEIFEATLELINKYYYDESIYYYIKNNTINELLNYCNIKNVIGLLRFDKSIIFSIASVDYDSFIKDIDELASFKKIVSNNSFLLDYLLKVLNIVFKDDDKKLIFEKRYGFYGEEQTLEEIGNEYNLTRERVRQICKKINEKIKEKTQRIESIISKSIEVFKIKNEYMTFDEVNEFLDSNQLTCFLGAILRINDNTSYGYDNEFKIFSSSGQ